jgi:hypothetical protein
LGAAVPGTPAWSVAATRMAGAETVPAARVPAAACSAAVGVVPWKKGVVLRLKGEVPVTVANGLTWRKEKLELIPGLTSAGATVLTSNTVRDSSSSG